MPKTFKGSQLRLFNGLGRAESLVLVQTRAGKIGVRASILHDRIPGVHTRICLRGAVPQTPIHLFAECRDPRLATLRQFGFHDEAQGLRGPLGRLYSQTP